MLVNKYTGISFQLRQTEFIQEFYQSSVPGFRLAFLLILNTYLVPMTFLSFGLITTVHTSFYFNESSSVCIAVFYSFLSDLLKACLMVCGSVKSPSRIYWSLIKYVLFFGSTNQIRLILWILAFQVPFQFQQVSELSHFRLVHQQFQLLDQLAQILVRSLICMVSFTLGFTFLTIQSNFWIIYLNMITFTYKTCLKFSFYYNLAKVRCIKKFIF